MTTVFFSYSHDSEEHKARVLALADRLRGDGVATQIDQYADFPANGWPNWSEHQLENASFVLVVSSSGYLEKARGASVTGSQGVAYESRLIKQVLSEDGSKNQRFVPVLLGDTRREDTILALRSYRHFRADTDIGYEDLYRYLTAQPRIVPAALGPLRVMSSNGDMKNGGELEVRFRLLRWARSRRAKISQAGFLGFLILLSYIAWFQLGSGRNSKVPFANAEKQLEGVGPQPGKLEASCGSAAECQMLAKESFENSDYSEAFRLFQQSCELGDVDGCSSLGVMYRFGHGVDRDDSKAASLYRTGCEGGNSQACANLGVMYQTGVGVEQDIAVAAALFRQTCELGLARGCTNFGLLVRDGIGLKQDLKAASNFFRQACEGGHPAGCRFLAKLSSG